MNGMSGMDMGHDIVIPSGALYTKADVEFMQGMIAHHAQAIVMSRLAESHGANPQVLKLSNKIDQSQVPEIRIMQAWLRRNNQFAPDTASWHHVMMSGMLTPAQLTELEAAKGVDFDRAYLRLMIQHHAGALKMVRRPFQRPGRRTGSRRQRVRERRRHDANRRDRHHAEVVFTQLPAK